MTPLRLRNSGNAEAAAASPEVPHGSNDSTVLGWQKGGCLDGQLPRLGDFPRNPCFFFGGGMRLC